MWFHQPKMSIIPDFVDYEPVGSVHHSAQKKRLTVVNLFSSGSRGSRTPDPLLVRQML